MMKMFVLLSVLLICVPSISQFIPANMEQFIADMYEQYTGETGKEPDYELFYNELMQLSEFPININDTNREQLSKLMFLSDIQIENLLYYLYKVDKMLTIYELQLVEGYDMTDIRRMLPFVFCGEAQVKDEPLEFAKLLKFGKNEMLLRFDLVPEQKAGYIRVSDVAPAYAGNALYHHMKYRFSYRDRLFLNITTEKDAGEALFSRKLKVYDFKGFSAQYQSKGFIRNMILGDFRASFGQGLVLNQAFGTGKSSQTTSVISRNQGFTRSGSTNEYSFFRGVAVTLGHTTFRHHVFVSDRRIDANVVDNQFSTIYTTGLHRTEREIANRNKLQQYTAGMSSVYTALHWQVGFSAVYNLFDKAQQIKYYPYNQFYFQGRSQLVSGLHYRFRSGKAQFFGEAANTGFRGFATLNGLLFYPASTFHLAIVQRYFAPEYNALYAAAFSESSRVSNESGWYVGLSMVPAARWKLDAYADLYRFPWMKYGADAAVTGRDFLIQAQFSPKRQLNMLWRLKYEQKAANEPGGFYSTSRLIPESKSALRYQLTSEKGAFYFRFSMELNRILKQGSEPTYGFSAMQDLGFQFPKFPLKVDVRYLFFDAPFYNNRIYIYEKDVLYAFSVPAFSGRGVRYYFNLNYQLQHNMHLYFRFAQTIFTDDRESIGTGGELIAGNVKTELKLLIRWKFQFK
jgi:hypothetical protein